MVHALHRPDPQLWLVGLLALPLMVVVQVCQGWTGVQGAAGMHSAPGLACQT